MKAKFLATWFGGLVGALTICATAHSQATRTWDGGGVGGTNMDTAVNWSGDTVPSGGSNDTAQWNGTVAGDLSLTYTATGTGANLGAGRGVFIDLTSAQTGAVTINRTSGTAGLRVQNITIASGAGAFTFGGDAVDDGITLGNADVDVFTWTNNSANTATITSDVRIAFGGGDNDNQLILTGSGNWLFNGHFGGSPAGTGSLVSTTKTGSGTMTINSDTRGSNTGPVDQGAGQVFVKQGAIVIESGGVLRALSTGNAEFASIGQNGTDIGTLTVRGTGQFIDDGDFNVGDVGSSQGTFNLQDSGSLSIVAAGGFFVGSANAAGSTASGIVNQSGGTVTANRTVDGAFVIGGRVAGASGSGTYNLSGGTVTNLGTAWVGGFGTGTVTHTAGDWNNTGAVFIGRQTGSTGTYHLNGGTLTTAGVNGGSGTSTLNLNGGTLKANANSATFMNGITTANVRNGGAVIDTNGFNVTASQSLVHSTIGGDNAIDGGLNKIGTGTLTLSGASTYTGPTAVNGGTLAVTGSLSNSSAVTVASGATLDGTGSVGATTVAVGGNLANGNGGTGTLTLNSLTFNGAATVNARVGGTVPISASALATTPAMGQVTINGSGVWANGNNNLIAFGTFGGALGNFSLGTVSGLNIRQTIGGLVMNGNNVALSVSGDNPKWTGLDNSNWIIGATGANKNWRLVTAGTTTDYIDGDAVLFDDSATGLAVDITAGNVSPTSVTFNNSTKDFSIAGTGGGISGAGGLAKSGGGSVTISASNSYTGLTTINAGTLTLSGANSTTGGTAFNGGTLNVNNASALGTGALSIGTGGVKALGNTSGAAVVTSGDIVQSWNDDFTFSGTVDGTHDLDMAQGAVTVAGAGDRTVTVSNGTLTVGEMRTSQGFVKQGAGTLVLTSNGSSGNGAGTDGSVINGPLNVVAGTVQFNRPEATTTGDLTVGGLTGGGRIVNGAASERWVDVNNSGNFSFSGTIENGGSGIVGFYKTGAGTQTMTGSNTITGPFTANAGTLVFSGSNTFSGASFTVNAGTLRLENANTITPAITVNAGGNLIVAHPGALGNTVRVNVTANNSSASLTFATDTDTTNVTPIGLGTFSTLNLVSDRATPGAAVNRTLTVLTAAQGGGGIGGGAINFTAGANVTSGVGRITFNQFGLGAGSDTTTLLNPTGVNLTLPDVSKFNNNNPQTLNLGGTTTDNQITGVISNILPAGTNTAVVSLIKSDTSTWKLSGASTYTGGTTINGGTLLVNNTTGSGTGTGAVTVNSGGTLGGSGIVDTSSTNANVVFNAGSSLAPGNSAGSLAFNLGTGTLNLSAVTAANAGGLKFEIGAPGTNDKVLFPSMTGSLNLGVLDFSDFTFTNLGGAAAGSYTLFDADAPIGVSLVNASGSFAGFTGTLSLANSNSEVILTLSAGANAGDFNGDGKVDAADYVVWRKTLNTPAKYDEWRSNFGKVYFGSGAAAGQSSLVPEPSSMALAFMGLMFVARFGRRRRT